MTQPWVRTTRAAAFAVGVIATSLCSAPAMAQVAPPGPITPTGTVSPLPTVGGRLFKLDVLGSIDYDSNISRGETILSNVKGLHKDDVLYQPSAVVHLNFPIGQQALFLTGNVGYDFHQYNKTLDSERIDLTGGGVAKVGSCGASGNLGYARTQSDQAYLPLSVTKNIQTVESAGLQLRCVSGRLGEFLSVQEVSAQNSAAMGLVNSRTVSTNGGLSFQNAAIGAISIFGSYSTSDYSSSNNPTLLASTGYETYTGGVSFARPIGTRLKGSAEFSYESARSRGAFATSFSGFGAQGSLEYRVTPRLAATLLFSRSVQPTIQQGSSFTVVDLVQLDGRYRLSSRISASLGTSWHNIDYRGDQVILPNLVTTDRTQAVYGNVTLTVGRGGTLAFKVRRETRNTNLTIFDYTDYLVGVTATKSF